jgi:hypothetical protein
MTLKGNAPTVPLQTPRGDLTPLGIAFIRRRFREFTDTGVLDIQRRRRPISELNDDELNQQFAKQSAWLEAIVQAEIGEGPGTALDFVLKDLPRKPLTLTLVAKRLQAAFDAGNTGHNIDSSILKYSVFGFVEKMRIDKFEGAARCAQYQPVSIAVKSLSRCTKLGDYGSKGLVCCT